MPVTFYTLTGELDYEPSVVLGVYGSFEAAADAVTQYRGDETHWRYDGYRVYETVVGAPASDRLSYVELER